MKAGEGAVNESRSIAYFSMEIGLEAGVPTYAGGSAFWPGTPSARRPT